MNPTKAMTIRLSREQAEQLETVATVDQQPIAAVIRSAIAHHIEARRNDDAFRKTLQERLSRAKDMLRK